MDAGTMQRNQAASDRLRARPAASCAEGPWCGSVLLVLVGTGLALLSGCVAQQADLKQTERELQRRIKQSTEELAQTRARQNQEIVSLREQDIPTLRGDVDKAIHRTQELEQREDNLAHRIDRLNNQAEQR